MSKKKKDWKTEKDRLLRLDREERRKEYRRQDFIPLDKIPTWREDNQSNEKEEGKELTGGGGLTDKVSLYKGDITVLEVDAIVNAANSSLLGGGGVDGCIHKAAGSCLYDECHSLNGCETGGGEWTGGGGLTDKVSLYKGDITVLEVDAIVNAANSSLLGGGGVDGCIHKAAGSCLYDECHSLNGCETGKAKITCGYDLPARYVIHTVGPVARGHVGPTETNDLTSCYQNSLRLMKEHGLSTVAFPCISTGIYGFPNEPAAEIALNTVKSWIEENPDKNTRVIFCVFLETDFAIYKKKMAVMFQDNDMEVTEEQLKGDNTPPSVKSTTKEASEESNRGKEETGDEDEVDNDAVGNEDVEMASQNPECPEEITGNEELIEENNDEENANQDADEEMCVDEGSDKKEDKGVDNDKEKEKEKEKDKDEDKADEEQPAAPKTEDDNDTAKSTEEMEGNPEVNNTGTSNGEEMKDLVEGSEEPDSIPTDSIQSKDTVEKKE